MPSSRCRKNESSSSSEYYTSESNKVAECKQKDKKSKEQPNKKEKPKCSDDKMNDVIIKMNKFITFVKKSDKKLENNLEKVNKKVKVLKENCVNYETTVKRLRKEKHLMVNGSDSYGMFFSYCPQVIDPNNKVVFEKKSHVLNLCYDDCNHTIKIKRCGIYVVNLTCQFDQPGQIAIFINDNPDLSSLTASNNSQNFITVHQILCLNKGDKLSVRNYLSPYPLTTSVPSAGIIPESKNVCLNIWKIAPEPEKCALPPKQNKEPWCYFESDHSGSDSSDSESSNSSNCSHKSHKSNSSKHSECSYEESSELSESCFINPKKYSGK